MGVPFAPYGTTNAAGTFGVSSEGFVQGMANDDPAVRYQLRNGVLAPTETLAMVGGVGIYVDIPTAGANGFGDVLGQIVGRATNLTPGAAGNMRGFSVFNQAHAWISTAASPVPQGAPGQTVPYFLFGSDIQITVGVDPALVNLDGSTIDIPVSWDFVGQKLVKGVAAYPADAITAASWAGGVATLTTTTAHGLVPGDTFTITGITPAGWNGTFVALTGTTGSTLTYALAANPGAVTTEGTLAAGGGYLPNSVKVMSVNPNGKVWTQNATTGGATWGVGFTALIKL